MRATSAIALPSFESYLRAHSKLGFSQILSELGLPQPATRVVSSASELMQAKRFPMVLKTPVGTASRGTWMVKDDAQLAKAVAEIEAVDGFADRLIVQDVVEGESQQAQAVFANGRLIASHAYRQIARGGGGGTAIKESVSNAIVRSHLARIGEHLRWHGALSVDYIVDPSSGTPYYFDCNPRLVEPMSAVFAGLDLVDVLLRVSRGETPASVADGRSGVRTHQSLQALLGCAAAGGEPAERVARMLAAARRTRALCRQQRRADAGRDRLDELRAADGHRAVALATPAAAHTLPKRGWGSHLLTPQSIRTIKTMDVGG